MGSWLENIITGCFNGCSGANSSQDMYMDIEMGDVFPYSSGPYTEAKKNGFELVKVGGVEGFRIKGVPDSLYLGCDQGDLLRREPKFHLYTMVQLLKPESEAFLFPDMWVKYCPIKLHDLEWLKSGFYTSDQIQGVIREVDSEHTLWVPTYYSFNEEKKSPFYGASGLSYLKASDSGKESGSQYFPVAVGGFKVSKDGVSEAYYFMDSKGKLSKCKSQDWANVWRVDGLKGAKMGFE